MPKNISTFTSRLIYSEKEQSLAMQNTENQSLLATKAVTKNTEKMTSTVKRKEEAHNITSNGKCTDKITKNYIDIIA